MQPAFSLSSSHRLIAPTTSECPFQSIHRVLNTYIMWGIRQIAGLAARQVRREMQKPESKFA